MAAMPALTVRMLAAEPARPSLPNEQTRPVVEPVTAAVPQPPSEPADRAPPRAPAAAQSRPVEAVALAASAALELRQPGAAAAPPAMPAPAVVGLPPAPDYAFGAALDPGPQPLGDITPEYPEGTESRSGYVVLRLLINEAGIVDNAAVVRSQPQGLFENSAITAFSAARFSPGRLLGIPVKSQMTIQVDFTPLNRGARVSGRGY